MNAQRTAALTIAVILIAAQTALAQAQVRYVEIIHAATAKVVFTENGQQGVFSEAELAYGEMRLSASSITFDSLSQMVTLEGDVRLSGPDFTLEAPKCDANLLSGVLRADAGIKLDNSAQGVSASAVLGTMTLDMETLQPRSAELSGDVKASWQEGLELAGASLYYDFREELCTLDQGFTAIIKAGLQSEQASALTGGDISISGDRAFLKTEGEKPRRLLLTASAIKLSALRLGIAGDSLASNLTVEKGAATGIEQALFSVRGTDTSPVSGWLLDSDGNRISFSAQSVDKRIGTSELVLSGNVDVSSPDFSLSAQTVVAVPEGDGVRVTIPERFRVDLAQELFQIKEPDVSEQPTE